MKKNVYLIIIILLLLSSCAVAKYNNIYIVSSAIKLNEKDAAAVYEFLQNTVKHETNSLKPEDKYIGGQTTSIYVENGETITQYAFLLDNLLVYEPNGDIIEYKINQEYFEKEFYPFVSRIFDKYFPVYYQITNSSKQLSIIMEKDGKTKYLEREDVSELSFIIAYNYPESEMVSDQTEGELCQIIIDDGIVNEIIHCFGDYVIFNNRKIVLPETYNAIWQN